MKAVHRAFRLILTVACALYLSGAHWMVLQLTAWTGMLVVRTEQAGVAEAVQTTFSGEQPCDLCQAIKVGQKEEKKKLPEMPMLKKLLEVAVLAPTISGQRQSESSINVGWPRFIGYGPTRQITPPTPPPLV